MKRILLFLFVCYSSYGLTAQALSEVPATMMLQHAKDLITLSQQAGLISSTNEVIDSLQISRIDNDVGTWEVYQKQHNYYADNQLQKELIQQKIDNTWLPEKLNQYYYNNLLLEKQITEDWINNSWQANEQHHFFYTPEEQLVKTYQQQWSSIIEDWQDNEVSEYIYQNTGERSAVKTAQWNTDANIWQEKDYMAYIYKTELPWLDGQMYFVWDTEENQLHSKYRWLYKYSQNILKSATYFYWDEATNVWVENAKVQYHYNADYQLTSLLFLEKTEENTWQDFKLCELFWGDVINGNEVEIQADIIQCQFPNPYSLGDAIHYQGLSKIAPYTFTLYDYMGRVQHQETSSFEGELQLPSSLSTAYYILIVRDKKGKIQYQNKLFYLK